MPAHGNDIYIGKVLATILKTPDQTCAEIAAVVGITRPQANAATRRLHRQRKVSRSSIINENGKRQYTYRPRKLATAAALLKPALDHALASAEAITDGVDVIVVIKGEAIIMPLQQARDLARSLSSLL